MERRLLPVNAFLALCTPGDVYPAVLAQAGYRLVGVEVPVLAADATVVIDVVAFRAGSNLILAAEAKSGANVEEPQAARYREVLADDVIRSASITVTHPGDRRVQPVYVCLAENVDRVLLGLGEAGVAFPVLAVADDRIEHHGAAFVDPDLQAALLDPVAVPGPPPRLIPVDEESSDDEFENLVLPVLVANLSHQHPQVSLPTVAEQAIRHLPTFGKKAKNRLVGKVDAAARRLADQDPATFKYHGRTGVRDYPVVEFVRSPEEAARQGRTQVYQAIARAATKPGRKRRAPGPDQMALFDDLIAELEQAGGVAEDDDQTMDEEGQ